MKPRAPRNRTTTCTKAEKNAYSKELLCLSAPVSLKIITDRIIHQAVEDAAPRLPRHFADLLILDPPYNLTKDYHGQVFQALDGSQYAGWFEAMLSLVLPLMRPAATVYVCSDWKTSALIYPILQRHLHVRNRITWEREKGRGARANWKNTSEDIWFCTVGDAYTFNLDAVKLMRRVKAPYRHRNGQPKDWEETAHGNVRLTHPSNLWTDITIPFWSMPENTDHPAQKPEKLIAKLLLASSHPGDFVLDPFLGSGTSAVVARKLGRCFCGIEHNLDYCCWALKRLERAVTDKAIQGYADGVFRERNSGDAQRPVDK